MIYFLAFLTSATPKKWIPVTDNGFCGVQNNGRHCLHGRICSFDGYCGTGPDYKSNCQPRYSTPRTCVSTDDGTCGWTNNDKHCAANRYCGLDGLCYDTIQFLCDNHYSGSQVRQQCKDR
eukprot:NODE_167_length_14562_cov_0.357256.p13 type:complete len:120 gc:universal NODE_167_length_14562_cov_0.357256:9974-9615(-)